MIKIKEMEEKYNSGDMNNSELVNFARAILKNHYKLEDYQQFIYYCIEADLIDIRGNVKR